MIDDQLSDDPFESILRDVARAPVVRLADLDLTGRTIGRYDVRRRVGEGGMGAVYEAWDTRLRRAVALKVLHVWRGDGDASRLVAEARRAAAMTHPNIAAVFDVDTIDGITFMALELVEGRSLQSAIASDGVDPATALRWSRQIASALARAHLAGIVHRDITPANVMIGPGNALKLLDFGIASAALRAVAPRPRSRGASGSARSGRATGTPGYCAPEQTADGPVDARADVYSFGVLLREMLASRPPRRESEGLRRSLSRLADRCAAHDPADRPRDGAHLAALLRAIQRDPAAEAAPSPVVLLGAALASAALAGAVHAWVGSSGDPGAGVPAARPAPQSVRAVAPIAPVRAERAWRAPRVDPPEVFEPAEPAEPAEPGPRDARSTDALVNVDPLASSAIDVGYLPAGEAATTDAPLPITAMVDQEGRFITIAEVRGLDARAERALGRVQLRAPAPDRAVGRGVAAPAAGQPLSGTLVVETARDGSMRMVIDLKAVPGASGGPMPIAVNDPLRAPAPPAGSPPSTKDPGGKGRPGSTRYTGPNDAVDQNFVSPKSAAPPIAGSSEGVHLELCGLQPGDELGVYLDESGKVHIAVHTEEAQHAFAAVVDSGYVLVGASEGVTLCDDGVGLTLRQ